MPVNSRSLPFFQGALLQGAPAIGALYRPFFKAAYSAQNLKATHARGQLPSLSNIPFSLQSRVKSLEGRVNFPVLYRHSSILVSSCTCSFVLNHVTSTVYVHPYEKWCPVITSSAKSCYLLTECSRWATPLPKISHRLTVQSSIATWRNKLCTASVDESNRILQPQTLRRREYQVYYVFQPRLSL